MTIEEAIQILDPETGFKAVSKYPTCDDSINACREAGRLAADELRKRQWISVKDRLPEYNQRVLVYAPCMRYSDTGPIAIQSGWMCKNKHHGITHWQPLPEPPKEG